MVFIDRVPSEIIWSVLERKRVTKGYIDVIRNMYEGAVTTIRSLETSEFQAQ